MAERPIFLPSSRQGRLVEEVSVPFTWHSGLAPSQKKKNVRALHAAASERGYAPLLEVSTKSDHPLGQQLSAFNLKVVLDDGRFAPLESAFQGSKVFEHGGPYVDLLGVGGREAKRDVRLGTSGPLVGFMFEGCDFPLVPRTAFYDWLYIRALHLTGVSPVALAEFEGFTDIEFNPGRSINCQARSCATFVAMARFGLLNECVGSAKRFMEVLLPDSLQQPHSDGQRQQQLFG